MIKARFARTAGASLFGLAATLSVAATILIADPVSPANAAPSSFDTTSWSGTSSTHPKISARIRRPLEQPVTAVAGIAAS